MYVFLAFAVVWTLVFGMSFCRTVRRMPDANRWHLARIGIEIWVMTLVVGLGLVGLISVAW